MIGTEKVRPNYSNYWREGGKGIEKLNRASEVSQNEVSIGTGRTKIVVSPTQYIYDTSDNKSNYKSQWLKITRQL